MARFYVSREGQGSEAVYTLEVEADALDRMLANNTEHLIIERLRETRTADVAEGVQADTEPSPEFDVSTGETLPDAMAAAHAAAEAEEDVTA